MSQFFKHYGNILFLLGGVVAGCFLGLVFGTRINFLKPVGDIFLNLLFTAVVPLVFFTISSSIAGIDRSQKFGKLMIVMLLVFVITVLIAAITTMAGVWLFPIGEIKSNTLFTMQENQNAGLASQITSMLTADDVYKLFSRRNMLALIIFSGLTGFAVLRSGESGQLFIRFLKAGNDVFTHILLLIMKAAPIGLGAYFAVQVGALGSQLLQSYVRAMALFHGISLFYYLFWFSVYAFVAGGWKSVTRYWQNNIAPSATAIGTCSSIATIPVNLAASKKMGIANYISNISIPLGATLHKDGSGISSVIKIAAVFALFHKPFSGFDVLAIALLITVFVSLVEGGIPSGGYLGELLVMSVYNFPAEAFPVLIIIGTLVDPVATVLNVCGDTAAGMIITRLMEGKNWLHGNPDLT